jgi:Ca-activated chloride channel family protein
VLVLSDGHANLGVTAPATLCGSAARALERAGVTTSTIALGPGFDEGLMTALAAAGGGSAHVAETPEDAPAIFGADFPDLVRVVARDVRVEIRPQGAVQVLDVLTDALTDVPAVPTGAGPEIGLGDAVAEERRRVVFRLHLPDLAALGPHPIAEVVVRYLAAGSKLAHREVRVPVTVTLAPAEEATRAAPDALVREEVVIRSAARAGERARELADAGDLEEARRILEAVARSLESLAPGSPRAQRLLEEADFWGARASLLVPFSPCGSRSSPS